jgi:hypothetical protein
MSPECSRAAIIPQFIMPLFASLGNFILRDGRRFTIILLPSMELHEKYYQLKHWAHFWSQVQYLADFRQAREFFSLTPGLPQENASLGRS